MATKRGVISIREAPREISGAESAIGMIVSSISAAVVVIGVIWAITLAPELAAQTTKPTEYQVKAVYLYNFGHFVEWPRQANDHTPFLICVLGADPFGHLLDSTLAGESIEGRGVGAKRISGPADAGQCRILFVSATERSRVDRVIGALNKQEVLTVSDMPQFIDRGGMIEFVADGNKIRFAVNLIAAQQAGLGLSSELLRVAMSVRTGPVAGER